MKREGNYLGPKAAYFSRSLTRLRSHSWSLRFDANIQLSMNLPSPSAPESACTCFPAHADLSLARPQQTTTRTIQRVIFGFAFLSCNSFYNKILHFHIHRTVKKPLSGINLKSFQIHEFILKLLIILLISFY